MSTLILDTDIGTDVDDALALGLLLGSPEVQLAGITTVYGDTRLRAQLTRRMLAGSHQPDIPVFAGRAEPLSGRDVWWAGHEGVLHEGLDRETFEERDAVDFLVDTVAAAPGEVDILAIGPLTNIAEAIRRSPAFVDEVRHVYVMGGDFRAANRVAEHNLRCDAVAAREVFGSRLPMTVAGLDVTTRVQLAPEHVARIRAAGAVGRFLDAEIAQWWRFHGTQWNNPHDPISALTLLQPDLFTLRDADVDIELAPGDEGFARDAAASRRTRLVTELDVPAVMEAIVARIEAAG